MKTIKDNLKDLTENVLNQLEGRGREIVILRFGLKDCRRLPLSQIGILKNISRERVRQIVKEYFDKIKKASKGDFFNDFEKEALEIIKTNKGFCERTLLKESLVKNPSTQVKNQLMFLLNCSDKIEYKKGIPELNNYWSKKGETNHKEIKVFSDLLFKIIQKQQRPLLLDEIVNLVKKEEINPRFKNRSFVKTGLLLNKRIGKNLLGEWGLKKWDSVSERGSKEKAYLILKKEQEPLHYKDITLLINKYWKPKKFQPQTIHNTIIRDERFIFVGKGIYGLKEWGFKGGTVKELIKDYLEKKGKPLPTKEITQYILQQKKVKKMTVLVNLTDKDTFEKISKGYYTLRRRVS